MPSNMLFMDTLFPKVTEEDSAKEAIKKILNYQFMLNEQLQYSFYNLGAENFNQVEWDNLTEPIYASIGDAESAITELALTSEGLGLRVSDAEKGIAELTVTSEGLTASVSSLNGTMATLTSQVDDQAAAIGFVVSGSGSSSDPYSITRQASAAVVAEVNNSTGSSRILLSADHLAVAGTTTFSSWLRTDSGVTTIDGGHIYADTLTVRRIYGVDSNSAYMELTDSALEAYNYRGRKIFDIGASSVSVRKYNTNSSSSDYFFSVEEGPPGDIVLFLGSDSALTMDGGSLYAEETGNIITTFVDSSSVYDEDVHIKVTDAGLAIKHGSTTVGQIWYDS